VTAPARADFSPLTSGNGVALIPALSGPDLPARGYVEEELRAAGTARSYAGHPDAAYATRAVVRRPDGPHSDTLVVEWLNVSNGQDATPDWNYLAEEIVRKGHVWAGVSAQYIGVHGGPPAVRSGLSGSGLTDLDPQRYGDLDHPGDAYCLDVYSQVARGLAADLGATCVLAVGASQSAMALTTYLRVVDDQPFHGFLVHSRDSQGLPLDEPGRGASLDDVIEHGTVTFRGLTTPVIVLQTATDLFAPMWSVLARQPDDDLLRTWEVAGTAHADKWQIGQFEEMLGCLDPVNRGQQVFVMRAALRWLEGWARGGPAAPSAPPLEVDGETLVLDERGIARGGVRTPAVDAPADVQSGFAAPGGAPICWIFGRTLRLAAPAYASPEEYLAAYERATDAAIAAGFVLPEDREAVLADARPTLVGL
jgi:hypothetical protein